MSTQRLRIAVVGHTNTGKTSLVRTLTHNRAFGQVRDQAGTTRRVATAELVAESGACIELFDSPGLENAPELIDWLDQQPGARHDGPARLRRLLDDPDAVERFDHEARVLELILQVDVALYVIDAREPVLEKYQDELAILGLCARPIVAVLNFTASPDSRETQWREALARVQLHTVMAFDAAVREPATELRLFEKLASLLDAHRAVLAAWLDHRRGEEARRRQAALMAIAGALIDIAAFAVEADADSEADQKRAWQSVQDSVRGREQVLIDTLLELYRFGRDDLEDDDGLPLSEGRWYRDPFDTETLRHYGLRASGYAAAGVGAGAAIDVATGGLTLGAGALAGALVGGAAGVAQGAGRRLRARLRGRVTLRVDDPVVRLIMARSLELLVALVHRGHGSPVRIRTDLARAVGHQRLPRSLRRARYHPRWSALIPGGGSSPAHHGVLETLAVELAAFMESHGEACTLR